MQALYPTKKQTVYFDALNVEYPVRRFTKTSESSETIARRWRNIPDIMHELREPAPEETNYMRNHNVTEELTRSQTAVDYGIKPFERDRHSKPISCLQSAYIYPETKKLADRPPACNAHGSTETQSSFMKQEFPSRLITHKEQFVHPASLSIDLLPVEPFRKEIEPLDTTHEGFEKYLDPYLTTSRLHHRPFTADQINRVSNTRDVMTYYTFSKVPWVRSSKPNTDVWRLPLRRPKSMYDREMFKEDFREIRTHNQLQWTPGSFRTESRDNYTNIQSRPESQIYGFENDVRTYFQRSTAKLPTNSLEEQLSNKSRFCTENSLTGSNKPLCTYLDPYVEKNKRIA